MRSLLVLALAVCCATASTAATTLGSFNVNIRLNESSTGICVSASQSVQTHALVTVTCNSGQFVNIEPRLNKAFAGVHGGAFRFSFSNRSAVPIQAFQDGKLLADWAGNGTVTALRVMNMVETDEKLELLVSF
jgi:hypothetical protein